MTIPNHVRDAFEKFVIKNPEGCWSSRRVKREGYWTLHIKGRQKIKAHRASWIIHNGTIPKGLFVCHHCDNPHCTRPDHLFLGTAEENSKDMIKKGRHYRQKGCSKRPASVLKAIRFTQYDLLLIDDLKKHFCKNMSNVVRIALQELHKKEIK